MENAPHTAKKRMDIKLKRKDNQKNGADYAENQEAREQRTGKNAFKMTGIVLEYNKGQKKYGRPYKNSAYGNRAPFHDFAALFRYFQVCPHSLFHNYPLKNGLAQAYSPDASVWRTFPAYAIAPRFFPFRPAIVPEMSPK
jgi:hypothetical protein